MFTETGLVRMVNDEEDYTVVGALDQTGVPYLICSFSVSQNKTRQKDHNISLFCFQLTNPLSSGTCSHHVACGSHSSEMLLLFIFTQWSFLSSHIYMSCIPTLTLYVKPITRLVLPYSHSHNIFFNFYLWMAPNRKSLHYSYQDTAFKML